MYTVVVAGTNTMDICTHEEADRRLIIHLLDTAEKGMKNIIIRTVDSDILAVVLEQFELITQKHDHLSVYVGFGKGKDYIVYDINQTFINIGHKLLHRYLSFLPSLELIIPLHFIEKPS